MRVASMRVRLTAGGAFVIGAAGLTVAAAAAGAQRRTSAESAATPPVAAVVSIATDTAPPPVTREFRGVWVATVDNIDWPSRPGLTTWEQQAEMIALLNKAVALRMNAVILQVRPEADAVYSSAYEPWSPFLTGEMGRAPEPFYDPLAFAVREAHARGLELHAWFNPYRALQPGSPGSTAPGHVSRERPDLVRSYGKSLWLDPGDTAVVSRSIRTVVDVVQRYDVDGVHIDDYFYPYPENDAAGRPADFPDASTWAAYQRAGGRLSRDDWRRSNVDAFIQRLSRDVHAAKPWVKFGVSPFGIWRTGNPPQIVGFDAYTKLYADARKWLQAGWVDYLTPQLYWPIAKRAQSYPVLLEWWVGQNTLGRNIWPGMYANLARETAPRGRGSVEILDQIRLTRAQTGATGNVFFSMKVFQQDPDSLNERLLRDVYTGPALVPASPWLNEPLPQRPPALARRDAASGDLVVDLAPADTVAITRLWLVQERYDYGWVTRVLPGSERVHLLAPRGVPAPLEVRIQAVNRAGALSPVTRLDHL